MAVVEDYIADSDDEDPVLPKPLPAESCSSSQDAPAKHYDTIGANIKGLSIHELLENLRVPHEFQKAEQVAQLPDEQIHATRCRILSALREIANCFNKDSSDDQSLEGYHVLPSEGLHTKAYAAITRLRAIPSVPDDALITPEITSIVNEILTSLKQPINMAHDILVDLKSTFSSNPHPEVSTDSGRRLIRPIGGDAGRSDMFEEQHWKAKWGVWNSLRWCVEVIPTQDLADNIPLILPPLLILMDDYEASYRLRGLQILPSFLRIPTPVLHRTGIAQLLLRSVQHSISLHTSSPEPLLLQPSIIQLFQLLHILYPNGQGKEEEVAKNVEQAVEKGIINGWAYAKSGKEGVESMVGVARAVELVCLESGLGVIRWMKTFIPSLLNPLITPPAPYIIPLQYANLQALHTLLATIQKTGRAARWRGEILNGVGRLMVALSERGVTASETDQRGSVNSVSFRRSESHGKTKRWNDVEGDQRQDQLHELVRLCTQIITDLVQVAPSMKKVEIPALIDLDENTFGSLSVLLEG